ncbi:MAG: NADH-quinone oxidoreductase subunit L [Holophagaceae bacterium]|uniref:NADH-quinone oxidoreductase subunit L n=1 Tax=Candidatus Geothrix skivensis TaxID=2954439 RepID=A0A9D7SIC5_9BACT|nr:NADH-quinone oxidoreductase subunit L [Candidatus Geothrix skivensis]
MTTTMTADMTLVHAATTAASQPSTLLWLIPFLPLFGFLINGLSGKKLRNTKVVDFIALGSVGAAFLLTLYHFIQLVGLPADGRSIHQSLWTWFDVGGARVLGGLSTYKIEWAYKFDALSGAMALLVTGAGFLIHLFSTGYMAEERNDGRYYRFMAYLNLFVFSMLNLVLGANIMMMFLGWEGVGLCSYLLIGFYFDKEYAAIAGKKAFVTNRIGDFGFMIGFFLIFMVFGSLDYDTLMGSVREISSLKSITLFGITHAPTWWFNLIGCCLFVGAAGKSAQIPLYVWLPDAMAGPTPVSALIHAATMVTSGLYMITRLNFIYVQAPVALAVVLFVGALTAFVAASMGLAQYDIKKVLAYSTVSQLGFMFMGLGAGAFTAGMFHVFTHAAFKACLFLGSGSVIMACHHEQDMRNMGGLRKYMPWTFLSMGLATLAIAGIFPFSGFFSKDEILWKVFEGWYHHGAYDGPTLNLVAWILGMLGAFMTAFYMTRLMIMTFYGEYRGAGHDPYHLTVPSEAHHAADDHGHGHGQDDARLPRQSRSCHCRGPWTQRPRPRADGSALEHVAARVHLCGVRGDPGLPEPAPEPAHPRQGVRQRPLLQVARAAPLPGDGARPRPPCAALHRICADVLGDPHLGPGRHPAGGLDLRHGPQLVQGQGLRHPLPQGLRVGERQILRGRVLRVGHHRAPQALLRPALELRHLGGGRHGEWRRPRHPPLGRTHALGG